MLEVLNLAGRPVAGQHDLLVPLVQRIECVKELLLNPLFARQKLDVIDQQHVRLPVFLAETGKLVVLDAVDVFVGELLGRNKRYARALLVYHDVLSDGVQQMGLAQTDSTVKEKRVVRLAGRLGHRQRRSVCKVVVVADHERVERVLWIEIQVVVGPRSLRRRLGRLPLAVDRLRRQCGKPAACAHFKLNLQLPSGRERDHVLQQPHVIVLEPDFTEVISHFQGDAVVFLSTGAQRSEPEIVDVCTQHGTKMFLRGAPDSFCGSLHVFLPKARFSGVLFT